MRYLCPSSEAEMIAEFLRQEYANHDRYGAQLDDCLRQAGVATHRITHPDLADPAANEERRRVLAHYRGYGASVPSYFTDFPASGVAWNWVALTPDEVLDSRYIRYEYWSHLAVGTRSPRVAADRLRAGATTSDPADPTGAAFLALAEKLRAGFQVPPPILVSADEGRTRVILEGHTRITAYALAPEVILEETHIILGASPAIANWDEY